MPKVISLAKVRTEHERATEAAQQEAFEEYVRLARKAQAEPFSVADGMAAGRAWGNFIGLFVRP